MEKVELKPGNKVRVTTHSNKADRTILGVGILLKKIGNVENYWEVTLTGPYVEDGVNYLVGNIGDHVNAMIYAEDLLKTAVGGEDLLFSKILDAMSEIAATEKQKAFKLIKGGLSEKES